VISWKRLASKPVIFAAFIDDPRQAFSLSFSIGNIAMKLSDLQRCWIAFVIETNYEMDHLFLLHT
jgi:hypothetical protein